MHLKQNISKCPKPFSSHNPAFRLEIQKGIVCMIWIMIEKEFSYEIYGIVLWGLDKAETIITVVFCLVE